MYRVMIIDDERAIRNLLRRLIDWENLGITLIGEAESGIEAINIIDDLKPDILFVDIRMPFMDGIQFTTMAVKRYPHIKVIILSAYNEFSYAQKCIEIGVTRYLLKPISRETLHMTLSEVIAQINDCKIEKGGSTEIVKIQPIKRYIEDHYRCNELNLTQVADHFGFNPSYLSRKFKEDVGVGFTEFLISYRMQKASQYAKRGEMMYFTAEQVGIPDPNYFGKCFKKYFNKSYSEYVKMYEVIK